MELTRLRRHVGVILAATSGGLLVGGAAFAVLTGFSGTSITQMRAVTETAPSFTMGAAWVNVPGATLAVPANAGSTFRARFSGESTCENVQAAAHNFCHTRIVLVGPGGVLQEFHPQSAADYRWDNTLDGRYAESHAMERLLRAPTQGVWTLRVQYSTGSPVTRLTLDDWTFTAETVAP